jgi:hypothetical protein
MPGDPKECREHARRCAELACTADTPEAKDHFASLATSWIKIAAELESAQALLDALDGVVASDEVDDRSSPKAA